MRKVVDAPKSVETGLEVADVVSEIKEYGESKKYLFAINEPSSQHSPTQPARHSQTARHSRTQSDIAMLQRHRAQENWKRRLGHTAPRPGRKKREGKN